MATWFSRLEQTPGAVRDSYGRDLPSRHYNRSPAQRALTLVNVEPMFRPLRGDPRFRRIRRAVGLSAA
jgi:hypothetical protein